MGQQEVILWMQVGGLDDRHVRDSMRLFAQEVMPQFKGKPPVVPAVLQGVKVAGVTASRAGTGCKTERVRPPQPMAKYARMLSGGGASTVERMKDEPTPPFKRVCGVANARPVRATEAFTTGISSSANGAIHFFRAIAASR